jgi:photosystem II stability/assembly factor-like uncharacterized protein
MRKSWSACPVRSRSLRVLLVLVATLLANRQPAWCQGVLQWTPIGPGGGTTYGLATAPGQPGTLFAGMDGTGLWRTRDGGASWHPALLQSSLTYSVAATAADPPAVYAGGLAGVWRSLDGGVSWTLATTQSAIFYIVIAPSQPQVLYAIGAPIFDEAAFPIYRSADGGVTWTFSEEFEVRGLAVDPADANLLYAGGTFSTKGLTPDHGVFARSTDGGQTWAPLGSDFFSSRWQVSSIVLQPGNAATIYACVKGDPSNSGVVKSVDRGATWTTVLPFPIESCALAADPAAPGTLYAGLEASSGADSIWKTTDGGATWTEVAVLADPILSFAVDGAAPGRVYAGTANEAVVVSQDGGAHWTSTSAHLPATFVQAVAVGSTRQGEIYAGIQDDVMKSTDGGASWAPTAASLFALSGTTLTKLVTNPGTDGLLYALTYAGLYLTTDGGRRWQPVTGGLTGVVDVAVDPANPSRIYAAGGGNDFVAISDDGGATWAAPRQPPVLDTFPGDPGFVPRLVTVAIDPADPARLYAAGAAGSAGNRVWTSHDRGQTWTRSTPPGDEDVTLLRIDPRPPGALFAVVGGVARGLYRSLDHGQTWTAADPGFTPNLQAVDLLIDPETSALYLATPDGVYASTDAGASWTPENAGLSALSVTALALDPFQPGKLYAATRGGGVLAAPGLCVPGPQSLCLGGGRFRATMSWQAPALGAGTHAAMATAISADTGTFWFRDPNSIELVVKLIDGRAVNGYFWVFSGALTENAYTLTIVDLVTGARRDYQNAAGELTSRADTAAFADALEAKAGGARERLWQGPRAAAHDAARAASGCAPGAAALCLTGSRFRVKVSWKDRSGAGGTGQALPLTAEAGAFWFFTLGDLDLAIKILDARAINGHFWMIYGSLSDLEFTVTVTDTVTGATRAYTNPAGRLASRADTAAF